MKTLLDEIAIAAMIVMLEHNRYGGSHEMIAECAYNLAEAMMKEKIRVDNGDGDNSLRLTPEQIGVKDGYRLLDRDEIGLKYAHVSLPMKEIEGWSVSRQEWDKNGWEGLNEDGAYRTKLTRKQLAAKRG